MYNQPEPPEELIKCFDDSGNEIEARTRQEIHTLPLCYWHATTGIWVVTQDGKILCGRRSDKLNQRPGCWQAAFGGHVQARQTYLENAVEELEEELGLKVHPEDLTQLGGFRKVEEYKHVSARFLYLFRGSEQLKFNDGEITEIKWLPLSQPWQEKLKHPDAWASNCSPEDQEKILEWLKIQS